MVFFALIVFCAHVVVADQARRGVIAATAVFGQQNQLSTAVKGNLTNVIFNNPRAIAVSAQGQLFVADTDNSRVLVFYGSTTEPIRIYQDARWNGVAFYTECYATGSSGTNQSLCRPSGLAFDSAGNLYVSDRQLHRIMIFPANGSTVAIDVIGQVASRMFDPFLNPFRNVDPHQASSSGRFGFFGPTAISIDSRDGLYVADTGNHRVVYYRAGDKEAFRVFGQQTFFSGSPNAGGLSAYSLNTPKGVWIFQNTLYIGDTDNNRVLSYDVSVSTMPTAVYGQGGSYTTNGTNQGRQLSSNSLSNPIGIYVDGNVKIFADSSNSRVLVDYDQIFSSVVVYGQPSSVANLPNLSASGLSFPSAVAVSSFGFFIADSGNNRVLRYDPVRSTYTSPHSPPSATTTTTTTTTVPGWNFGSSTTAVPHFSSLSTVMFQATSNPPEQTIDTGTIVAIAVGTSLAGALLGIGGFIFAFYLRKRMASQRSPEAQIHLIGATEGDVFDDM